MAVDNHSGLTSRLFILWNHAHSFVSSESVTNTLRTLLFLSVSVKAFSTHLAVVTLSVEQTFQTLTGPRVTISFGGKVDVIVALTWAAFATRKCRIAIEVFVTVFTSTSGVSLLASANRNLLSRVIVAGIRMIVGRSGYSRTRTRLTGDVRVDRVSVKAFRTHFTMISGSVVQTVDANPCLGITGLCMPITLAPTTIGIVPEARLTFITSSSVGVSDTFTVTFKK